MFLQYLSPVFPTSSSLLSTVIFFKSFFSIFFLFTVEQNKAKAEGIKKVTLETIVSTKADKTVKNHSSCAA
jgi:hypothetical protein